MLKRFLKGSVVVLAVVALGCSSTGKDAGGDGTFGDGGGDGGSTMQDRGGSSGDLPSGADLRSVYFDYDRDNLVAGAKDDLKHNAGVLKGNGGLKVEIQGNCDERGSGEYNLALGMRRAESARRYLMDLGVDGSQMSTISFGEENPAVRASNEGAWAKNRRDDFKVK